MLIFWIRNFIFISSLKLFDSKKKNFSIKFQFNFNQFNWFNKFKQNSKEIRITQEYSNSQRDLKSSSELTHNLSVAKLHSLPFPSRQLNPSLHLPHHLLALFPKLPPPLRIHRAPHRLRERLIQLSRLLIQLVHRLLLHLKGE